MKYLVYENRITHQFAVIRLPPRFVEGDKPPIPPGTRWFATRDEALATLASLFDQDEDALLERDRQ
jgi:hypothetical protein